jgi:phosphoenolpyruvate carboxykinase (ATP)
MLNPRSTWQSADAYDAQARKVATMFRENFRKLSDEVDDETRTAEPRVA